jgi:hypothetical protein
LNIILSSLLFYFLQINYTNNTFVNQFLFSTKKKWNPFRKYEIQNFFGKNNFSVNSLPIENLSLNSNFFTWNSFFQFYKFLWICSEKLKKSCRNFKQLMRFQVLNPKIKIIF